MKDLITGIKYDVSKVIEQAIGSSKKFCMGYMNPGAPNGKGYICAVKLSVGTVDIEYFDAVTERIVVQDHCAKKDAYIGQINRLSTSSFCGQNGALWGFDLALYDEFSSKKEVPLYMQAQAGGPEIPVYSVAPLLDATERLFGKEKQRRFPPMSGAHVICGNKDVVARGPLWVWSSIGIAISKNRADGSCLFVEDADTYGDESTNESDMIGFLEGTIRKISNSIVLCGQDQGVEYDRIYVGYKYTFVESNQVGCALACTPHIYLAQNAVPKDLDASDFHKLTLSEWEKKLGLPELKFVD